MSNAASHEHGPAVTHTSPAPAPARAHPPPKKRRRRKSFSASDIRKQVCVQAQYLRRRGISPNTLFFPSLSPHSVQEHDIRAVLGTAVHGFKTVPLKGEAGGCMAWVTMASEQECMDGLLQLRTVYPALVVSFHKPSQASDAAVRTMHSNQLLFDERLTKVIQNGGVGNTLMFRNVPIEVCQDEFSQVLQQKLSSTSGCDVLRVRTSIANNGNVRNFWVVFSGIQSAKSAFCVLNHNLSKFRCGKSVRLNAIIHDDSTDVDENKRRQRAMALGSAAHAGQTHVSLAQASVSSVQLLEAYLRETNAPLLFTDLYS